MKDTTHHLDGATFNTGILYMYMCICINYYQLKQAISSLS